MTQLNPESIDPQGRIWRTWDWTSFLRDGDTITAHTVTGAGVTVTLDTHDATTVTALIAPAEVATGHVSATCHIETTQGEAQDDTWRWYITDL